VGAEDIDALAIRLTQAASLDRERYRHAAHSRFSARRMATEHLDLHSELHTRFGRHR
jgi:hypothetical protein